ncbi:MAG: hypothetical protein HEP71_33135 [Roseivirga sp.]|nr:hypothetical protein [Roseivirga sp.]
MKKVLSQTAGFIGKLIVLVVVPFIVLIRGSVFFHEYFRLGAYFSLTLGGFITIIILLIYLTVLYKRLFKQQQLTRKSIMVKAIVVSVLLFCYAGYTLFYLSDGNAKTATIQEEFTSLHPIIRVSVGTILLIDRGMLITDMSRTKEDYKTMGLKTLNNSLHYPQSDGHVHAMDLRTNGRSGFRNFLLKAYFDIMGFHTLRHVGTADHLHISLSIHENPDAI